jgi:hypothetical protein
MLSDAGTEAVRQRLSALEAQYSDELGCSEAKLIALAEPAVAHWRAWWRTPENSARPRVAGAAMVVFSVPPAEPW